MNPKLLYSPFSISSLPFPKPVKYLVFVNPHAGKGSAKLMWRQAEIILSKADIDCHVVISKSAEHVIDTITNFDLEELKSFTGIVSVSGDGIPYLIVNSLIKHPNWEELKHLAVGSLPGGSGNGICHNMCQISGLSYQFDNLVYMLTKGRSIDIDLIQCSQINGQNYYSFITFSWAFIAEVDLGSEL